MRKVLWLIAGIIMVFYFLSDEKDSQSSTISTLHERAEFDTPAPGTYCIKKETWGAFSKDDLDKMIEYSVNKEVELLETMIINHRVINIKKGTKVILVDFGLTKTVIRAPNSEIKIWIVSDAIGKC